MLEPNVPFMWDFRRTVRDRMEPKANAKHQQTLVAPKKLVREDLFCLVYGMVIQRLLLR